MSKQAELDKKIVRALRRNPDTEAVAEKLELHVSTIYRAIKRTGVELNLLRAIHGRPADTEATCYRYLIGKDVSKTEIARKFGVTVAYVSQITSQKQVA